MDIQAAGEALGPNCGRGARSPNVFEDREKVTGGSLITYWQVHVAVHRSNVDAGLLP
jgi:hypothetical protein